MKYNYVLNRYYNGCNYIEANPDQFNKYIDRVINFKTQLDEILTEIEKKQIVTENEILGGFEIC